MPILTLVVAADRDKMGQLGASRDIRVEVLHGELATLAPGS